VNDKTHPLTIAEAKFKIFECREMAKRSNNVSHQIMLEHMAETWERIAEELETATDSRLRPL
jgi:hypothetical protein